MPNPTDGRHAELLRNAFEAAVRAVQPGPATSGPGSLGEHLAECFPEPPAGRMVVVGAGKAAAAMAQAAEAHYHPRLGDGRKLEGLVVTRYGAALPTESIEVVEAGHPIPDEAGRQATQRVLRLVRKLGPGDLLLCLISGGGSALLTAPAGVSALEQADLTRALLRSGATIQEMNVVRKHLSHIKGGRLAAASPARVVSLILSDVAGDDPSAVASGPTVPDPSTFQQALDVLDRYGLEARAARAYLERGAAGEIPETPKPGDPLFDRVHNHIVAGAQRMLEAAAAHLEAHGIRALILSESLTGEARQAAVFHAALARQVRSHGQPAEPPCALISGGETTVTVRGRGRGGRNTEFLLALGLALGGLPGVHALAADSDGIDGDSDNAGALLGPDAFARVSRPEAARMLDDNDSYAFFERAGGLLVTGPTHTNVNDLRIVLIL
ncbi:MAG TPA: DUF4147 domain-containing protein [Trueperaceae bacterium]